METNKGNKTPKNKMPARSKAVDFPIVGIGASAGGLEALEQFFRNMPRDNGMAFIIIQHLDPDHADMMPELLQRVTPMTVQEAADQVKVKPHHVYIIPPNRSLSLLGGTLHIFERIENRGLSLPIDIFFRSMADDRQERSIAIILSGMGSDGSLGLKAIKEKNGIVLVQDPRNAKFDGMPTSAVESVNVDIIAPVNELPSRLISLLKSEISIEANPSEEKKNKSNLDKVIILLREQTGHDFSMYKKNTLFRRIERRTSVHELNKIENYVRFLQENPKEGEILFKELLIGVTSFFRDKPVWDALREKVLPELFANLPDEYVLRAWVPGCSTGEEAYSLAMVFKEAFAKMNEFKKLSLQIFATDLDSDAIDKARKGFFPKNIDVDVSPGRIKQFFVPESNGYRVSTSIREMVVFAYQNVIKDPPFSRVDIVSCRNMLIYIEPEMQKKLIALFNYSLGPGGILILGSAETIGNANDGFREFDARLKIFKRSSSIHYQKLDFPSSVSSRQIETDHFNHAKSLENVQAITDQILLQHFSPASVVVNERGDIIYITGRTGKYIEPIAGKANWNIYAMAKEGLRSELPGAIRKVMQGYDPVTVKHIKISGDSNEMVEITVHRLEKPEAVKGLIIVVFKDIVEIENPNNDKMLPQKSTKRMKEMEVDLQHSHEELQSTREEMQTSQEELKSINEEQQSTNEELQSTNEELTTSKEEMQSLNEELQTVNAELQSKISDLLRTNEDMKNLLNSTEVATLFLDNDLNIRRFTDYVSNVFKIRNSDIGRPFTDLSTSLQYPDLPVHTRKVLQSLSFIQKEIESVDGRWFHVRIMPYRTLDDHIDGLVLTFTDITASKKLIEDLEKKNEELTKAMEMLKG